MKPSDLARHDCLNLSHIPDSTTWSFRMKGARVRVDVKGPIIADSAHMLLKLAIEGDLPPGVVQTRVRPPIDC
jgi:hypothetical protein